MSVKKVAKLRLRLRSMNRRFTANDIYIDEPSSISKKADDNVLSLSAGVKKKILNYLSVENDELKRLTSRHSSLQDRLQNPTTIENRLIEAIEAMKTKTPDVIKIKKEIKNLKENPPSHGGKTYLNRRLRGIAKRLKMEMEEEGLPKVEDVFSQMKDISSQIKEVQARINEKLESLVKNKIDLTFVKSSGRYHWWIYDGWLWRANRQYTKEKIELLILDKIDKERRKFERLKKKYKQTEDVAEARRERIPEDVRIFVWRRDEGKCVKCGSQENLEYDHIIPVTKGGSNTARNIQLLCEKCNREKSDKI